MYIAARTAMMIRGLLTWIGIWAILGLPVSEAAEPKPEAKKKPSTFQTTTIIDFSDVTIQGEPTKPEGSYVLNRKQARFTPLLKLRANFLPELFSSIDSL